MITVLDVGGSSIKAGRVDDDLRPVGEVTTTALDNGASADELLACFVAAAESVDAGQAVALAMPDPFDHETGRSLMNHKFGALYDVPLVARLAEALGGDPDIRTCNDAAAAVVGEAVAGAGADHRRVLGLTLGTGLGAALVVDGAPVPAVDELVVGDLYRRPLADGRLADDALSARALQQRREADERDVDIVFGRDLGAFLGPVVEAVRADIVVVGGGGSGSFDAFGAAARSALAIPIVCARLGGHAAIIGAARICFG